MYFYLSKNFRIFKYLLSRQLQIRLRRYFVLKKKLKYKHIWPIDPNADKRSVAWCHSNISGGFRTLRQNSEKQESSPFSTWPDNKKFALVLTHDVEKSKGLNKCYQLADIEERLGFRSSFNFVPLSYNPPTALHQHLGNRGFEIGVYGLNHNGNPFRSESLFKKQADEINGYLNKWGAVGFRSPKVYHNLELLHHLNIEYDASTFDTDLFKPQLYAVGTIFPFWVSTQSSSKGFVELPCTLPQDNLLFILMQERNIDIWKTKLDWIADQGGMALLNVNPDYMNTDNKQHYEEYPARYYREFLEYIKFKYEGQYWNVLPKVMSRYWAEKHGHQENSPLRTSEDLTNNPWPA